MIKNMGGECQGCGTWTYSCSVGPRGSVGGWQNGMKDRGEKSVWKVGKLMGLLNVLGEGVLMKK